MRVLSIAILLAILDWGCLAAASPQSGEEPIGEPAAPAASSAAQQDRQAAPCDGGGGAGDCCGGGEIGHHLSLPWFDARTAKLLDELHDCDPHHRAVAVGKLGCCWNTNPASHPEIVPALIACLQCDGAWKVRQKAAWSIAFQNVANRCGWTSLYVASRLDPHWMVRDTAANALKVIETQLDLDCIRAWKTRGDMLVKQWRGQYKPGTPDCVPVF